MVQYGLGLIERLCLVFCSEQCSSPTPSRYKVLKFVFCVKTPKTEPPFGCWEPGGGRKLEETPRLFFILSSAFLCLEPTFEDGRFLEKVSHNQAGITGTIQPGLAIILARIMSRS